MAYDQSLALRIRDLLSDEEGLVEKKMFGGVGFMLHGNMACGVHKDMLVVRVGPEGYGEAMAKPHTLPFDITGRSMRGWVMVSAEGYAENEALEAWVNRGINFALTLPSK
jgi:hypothetical protein